jgi:hypothetical protein
MKSFNGKFEDTIQKIKKPHQWTALEVQNLIETVLGFMDTIDNDSEGLQMLCGIVIPEKELRLVKTERKVVSQVDLHGRAYDYVGVGDSSILRFLGALLARPPHGGFMERHAAALGTYLVCRAKAFVDGCGGDTDIFVLHKSGVLEIRSSQAFQYEQNFMMLESFAGMLATRFFDRRVESGELDTYITTFTSRLRQEHASFQVPRKSKYELEDG